ncbi:MAG: DNA topoisomerase IV subunit B [Rhizobiales bacterium]|nr:DNA topoisomerase IV subunit B [Hyphomicrobiales bacterium]
MDNNDDLFGGGDNNAQVEKTTATKQAVAKPLTVKSGVPKKEPIKKPAKSTAKSSGNSAEDDYGADAIDVLEGLEPVRMRPGMYIGGTDEKAMHHLFAEVIDNSMDEAVAGHASWIEVELDAEGYLSVTDNGRGIPVAPHPKYEDKSTVEVVMTILHAGGKFDGKAYETSGGLHGVGISVVNALSEHVIVEVARNKKLYIQEFSRGIPIYKLKEVGDVHNRRGTKVKFKPDPDIFGKGCKFSPDRLFKMARSKAYLFGGVEIRWTCAKELISEKSEATEKATFHFPGGLKDYLEASLGDQFRVTLEAFSGKSDNPGKNGSLEWAIAWHGDDGFVNSYCNTIPTGNGGTHEAGFRIAITRGLKAYGEMTGVKKVSMITTDDVMTSAAAMLSVFIREPEFVGQTKDKLATVEAQRIVENAIRDPFDHWLAASPQQANKLLEWVIDRADERMRRRKEKEVNRKGAKQRLRLPGKLADCSSTKGDTELFIVEGDSAGGSAKQGRNRATQAILPLRGKILNVASASREKISANQQISDLILALGVGTRSKYRDEDLRYERIIIMTDADVDGAHIASLLITLFYQEMPDLIRNGHLFLAIPPLYKITQGSKTIYAKDDAHKDVLMESEFSGKGKIDITRFKGLGEMMPAQLKLTTMDPSKRTLLRVEVMDADESETRIRVDQLMGNKPEARFKFIQENAEFAEDDALDV